MADGKVAAVDQIGVTGGGFALQRADRGLDWIVDLTDVDGSEQEDLTAGHVRCAGLSRIKDRAADRRDIGGVACGRCDSFVDRNPAGEALMQGYDLQCLARDAAGQRDAGRLRRRDDTRGQDRRGIDQRDNLGRDIAQRRQGRSADRIATNTIVGQVFSGDGVEHAGAIDRDLHRVIYAIGAGQVDGGQLCNWRVSDSVEPDITLAQGFGHIGVQARPKGQKTFAAVRHVKVKFVACGTDSPVPRCQRD